MKNTVAARSGPVGSGGCFLAPAWAKRWSEGCLFDNPEDRKWHPKTTLYKSSALGPSKNDPGGSVLKKHETSMKKSMGKSMVFDGPKQLKSIEKHILFLILGHSQK